MIDDVSRIYILNTYRKKHVNVNGGANTFVKPALSENERLNDTGKALYNLFLFTLFLF